MSPGRSALAPVLLAVGSALAGCGTAQPQLAGDRISGTTLTVYASVPLHGASRAQGLSVLRGAQLALAQIGGRIGRYRVVFKPLDDSTPQRDAWDPGQTTLNARTAIKDGSTIGYIGEFNSGASAVSIPVLNRLGIPEISPSSTAVGLTSSGAGAAPGEPTKYYPTGKRTYIRVVPNDVVQASAEVRLQKALGCRRTSVVDDGEVDGEDLADSFQLVARSYGLDVIGVQAFSPRAVDYASFAAGVAQGRPDCVLISAITDSGAVNVTRAIAAALPNARIFGSAGVAESSFTDPARGGIPFYLDSRVLVTVATLSEKLGPPSARAFYAAYLKRYGVPEPYAIFGYEAMSLLLNAIWRATDHGTRTARRSRVLDDIFDTRERHSVLGTYSVNSDGDTTIARYGVYRVVDGGLQFWKSIDG